MAEIRIDPLDAPGNGRRYRVTVLGEETTEHEVTVSEEEIARLGGRFGDPADLVRASFAFLLEREPNTSILPSFELSVIGRYFPDYEREITSG